MKDRIIVCFLLLAALPAARPADASEPLFGAPPASKQRSLNHEAPYLIRSRAVAINLEALRSRTAKDDRIELNLFDDTSRQFRVDRIGTSESGVPAWYGRVEGERWSVVTFIERDGVVAGTIKMPGHTYRVRPVGRGQSLIEEVDESAFPAEGGGLPTPPVELFEPGQSAETAALSGPIAPAASGHTAAADLDGAQAQVTPDSGALIDVLVVYTPEALAEAGSVEAIEAEIALAEVETNLAFENSGIFHRIRIVHTAAVDYDEAARGKGNERFGSTILADARGRSDGYMDEIHGLRDQYCADMVAVLMSRDAYVCGIAYVQYSVSESFASSAFSVTSVHCVTGNYTFAHELGHNMGAHHDWFVTDDLDSPFSFNKGHNHIPDRWRTIMSYVDKCSWAVRWCSTIPYFSNPDVLHKGYATGVRIGTSTECVVGNLENPDCDADNRQVLNLTAPTVANFRKSCLAACGDGAVNLPGEECDGGDDSMCPGECSYDCRCPYCGDGIVNQSTEECDTAGGSAICNADCTLAVCGDGILNTAAEECEANDDSACPGECNDCRCPRLDPFMCYRASSRLPVDVMLADEFGAGRYVGKDARMLCAPTGWDGDFVYDPETFLQGFRINGSASDLSGELMRSRLGDYFFDTKKVDLLLVPTATSPMPGTPPDAVDPGSRVDNYRCMKTRKSRGNRRFPKGVSAQIDDAFGSLGAALAKPTRLCVPTGRDGSAIKDGDAYLVCYKVKADRRTGTTGLQIRNDLLSDTIDLKAGTEVCVPAVHSATCGNDVVDGPAEICDGLDDDACGGRACQSDCTCGPADLCSDAVEITEFPFSDHVDTTGATVSDDDPSLYCGYPYRLTPLPSVWYRITAPRDGRIKLSTEGSDYSLSLAVLGGSCGIWHELVCDHGTSNGEQVEIEFEAASGTSYLVRVSSTYRSTGGNLRLTASF